MNTSNVPPMANPKPPQNQNLNLGHLLPQPQPSKAMDTDPSQDQSLKQKAQTLHALTTGPLSSSLSNLSSSSRAIPSDQDFHFYNNFDEFKLPIKEITVKSHLMLETVGSSSHIWGKPILISEDPEDTYDWLVNVNDELFERFDVSADEFQKVRKKEEETGRAASSAADVEDGFQLVYGRKKKAVAVGKDKGQDLSPSAVKVASRDKRAMGSKPRVPFHIPTIPRPQDEFNILVNNSNQPFQHVWLKKSEDDGRFIHPLENLSVLDFVDKNIGDMEPVKPPLIEITPFKLVEEVKDLKALAAKLRSVDEFAVDLEHNQYRSFQGMTCLMQISTRNEDFIVDTLKLRIHIGPHLREVFKDPTKKKVMHGADRDIVWLQRDFGIYVCNLFDTGQASRVLKLERNSLEYLLHHFCGVTANKEYQNADWRLRPIPEEMVRYAREDTHYLLYIFDLLRISLLSTSSESGNSDVLLVEVYKRSYEICMQLYEKELLTDSSYLYIYGLQEAAFNAQQLAIVAGLCEWRDVIARAEDESTGYILPNKTLLEIAKQMPATVSKLRRLVQSKHPYVERNVGSVLSIIRHSIQNAAAFEAVAEYLKQGQMEMASEEVVTDGFEDLPPPQAPTSMKAVDAAMESIDGGNTVNGSMAGHPTASVSFKEEPLEIGSTTAKVGRNGLGGSYEHLGENGNFKNENDGFIPMLPRESITISGQIGDANADKSILQSTKVTGVTVQVLKKPSRAFGALLGSSAPKRKFDLDKRDKEVIKLEQIKASVNLPFHSFSGKNEQSKLVAEEHTKAFDISHPEESLTVSATSSNLEEIILLESNSGPEELGNGESEDVNVHSEHREDNSTGAALEMDEGDEPMSLSDLSSSFQKCFQSMNQTRKAKQVDKSQESVGFLQLKPFDYEAARKQVRFGDNPERESGAGGNDSIRGRSDSGRRKNRSVVGQVDKDDGTGDFPQGRRRQAFPASGNRSATFR